MGAPMGNRNAAGKRGRHTSKLLRERKAGKIRGKKSRRGPTTWLKPQQKQKRPSISRFR